MTERATTTALARFFHVCLLALLAVTVIFTTFQSPTLADDDDDDGTYIDDDTLNDRYDWVMTVNTESFPRYLRYRGSGLNPLTTMKVTVRNTNRLGRQRSNEDVLYEELWYHECKPVGLRRLCQLSIGSGEQGAIYFKPGKEIDDSACSVANACIRLLLDSGLAHSMVGTVIVPKRIFSQVVDSFGRFSFFPYNVAPDTGIAATMHIHLTSQPAGRQQSVYYFGYR